jgi:hypothetical protein
LAVLFGSRSPDIIRPGVYVGSIFAAAFGFGVAFDVGVTAFWDNWNKGVRWELLSFSNIH